MANVSLDALNAQFEKKGYNIDEMKALLSDEISKSSVKFVVLDDDPTGVQTVHGITVFTDWTVESIKKGFALKDKLFYILTNSRGQTSIIMEIGSIEYRLLNDAEQSVIDTTLTNVSRTLTYNMQFFSTTVKVDTNEKIYEIMENMRKQSIKYGTTIITETVTKVDLSSKPYTITTEEGHVMKTKSIIIATGANARRLHVKGEDIYWQNGVSACAVCDGAIPIFRNQVLMVVGGGDTAMEEALHLTKYGKKIIILHRRDQFRASKVMQQKVLTHPKIEVIWNATLTELMGDGDLLNAVKITDVNTKEEKVIEVAGLFYAIGHSPNTAFLDNQITTDSDGYIVSNGVKTNVDGVFACGDVCDKVYRQAIVAAGSGCQAALECEKYLQQ